jgi:hypothetical protein
LSPHFSSPSSFLHAPSFTVRTKVFGNSGPAARGGRRDIQLLAAATIRNRRYLDGLDARRVATFIMITLDDPVNSVAIWTTLAFLLWLLLSMLGQRLRIPHVVFVTAPLSWIVARVFLSVLPAIIHHMELWFGT